MISSAQVSSLEPLQQVSFIASPCNQESIVNLSDFNKLLHGIIEIHDTVAIHAYGHDFSPNLVLTEIHMNSPINFSVNIFKDLVDAIRGLIQIPFDIGKAKKELEEKEIDIEKKREEASILNSESQHQDQIQSLEIQRRLIELDRERIALYAFGHEKAKEILTSLSSLNDNPQAAQLLAPHTERVMHGIKLIAESHMELIITDIKPIYSIEEDSAPKSLPTGTNQPDDSNMVD